MKSSYAPRANKVGVTPEAGDAIVTLTSDAAINRATANVVVANLSAREDHPIRFVAFLRYGVAVVAASMLISTAYLWVRYLA